MSPILRAMRFWIKGMSPPPTTMVINSPDAVAVYLPKPSVARLKITAEDDEQHLGGNLCINEATMGEVGHGEADFAGFGHEDSHQKEQERNA